MQWYVAVYIETRTTISRFSVAAPFGALEVEVGTMAGDRKGIRRLLSACAALVVVMASCTQGTQPDRAPGEPLEVTQTGLLPFFSTVWPAVIAKDQGFFEKHGLDVSFVWGFEGPQIFAGNQADILLDSSEGALLLQVQGLDVVAFYPLANHVTVWLLAGSHIQSVEDLAGKTIGVSDIPSTDQFLAIEFLESNGLSAEEVDFIKIEQALSVQAIEAGRIDASANIEDFLARQALQSGDFNVLATGEDYGAFPWTILHARRAWMQEHPEALRGYVQAVHEATQFILDPANREAVIAAIAEESEGAADEASINDAYEAIIDTPDYFPVQPLTTAGVARAVEALEFTGALEAGSEVDVDNYLDMRVFEQVVGQG
jgi:NitT/TauT family transport system substrate-binding protein